MPVSGIPRRRFLASFTCVLASALVSACTPAPVPPTPTSPQLSPTAVPAALTTVPPTGIPTPDTQQSTPTPDKPTATSIPASSTPVPSPTTAPTPLATPTVRLQPNGPPRDPGPLDWAHPGPYLAPDFSDFKIDSFAAKQPVATTYYFYWHDLTDPTRLDRIKQYWAQQPPNPESYSFLNVATHRQQFEDMQAAGLDFALPVYWGEPGHPGRTTNNQPNHYWSTDGIPPMIEALDQMASAGHPFKVGMFYDTTILANADLTTPNGKAYFYTNIRDYYSRFPPRYWAAIDGKPIVWLYDTQWVSKFDQSSLDYVTEQFSRDFAGLKPYIVREWQWYQSKGVTPQQVLTSNSMYAWGAAPSGFNEDTRFGVAEVGPGFSNVAYCKGGLAANCFDVNRENGAFYERSLKAALRSGRQILAAETWNEFSEGSDIAETVQDGRKYIDLTRKYADLWHAR